MDQLKEEIVNLDDAIERHAEAIYEKNERKDLEKCLGCKLPWAELRKEIDTCELLVQTTVPNYANCTQPQQQQQQQSDIAEVVATKEPLFPNSRSSCVFETVYTNGCENDIVNTINTTRTTRASCSFRLSRGFVLNREFGIRLALPKEILQFNTGFSSEISIGREADKTVENEINWSINTEIRVPGSCSGKPTKVSAKVMIDEREFHAKFTAVTYLSGKLKVRLFTKDNCKLLSINIPNLRQVFTENLGFVPVEQQNSSKICFVTTGGCHAQFGISQSVDIRPISSEEEE